MIPAVMTLLDVLLVGAAVAMLIWSVYSACRLGSVWLLFSGATAVRLFVVATLMGIISVLAGIVFRLPHDEFYLWRAFLTRPPYIAVELIITGLLVEAMKERSEK